MKSHRFNCTIFTLVALSALGLADAKFSADWQLTVNFEGTRTVGTTTWPINLATGVVSANHYNKAGVAGEVTCTVKWIGAGTPPSAPHYLRITPKSVASAHGGAWTLNLSDALNSRKLISSGSGYENQQMVDATIEKIDLDTSGEMTIQLSASATSEIISTATTPVAEVAAGYEFAVVDRGMSVILSSPIPTFRRAPGGISVNNILNPPVGLARADTVMTVSQTTSFGYTWYDIVSEYEMYGTTLGYWDYPLDSLEWSRITGQTANTVSLSSGIASQIIRRILFSTSGFDTVDPYEDVKSYLGHRVGSPLSPLSYDLTGTDSLGSESKRLSVYTHGPVEDTGEFWASDFTGLLNQSTSLTSIVGSKFDPIELAAWSNQTSVPQQLSLTISSSKSINTGVEVSVSVGGTFSAKDLLEFKWGVDELRSTSTTYEVGQTYAFSVTVPPGKQITLTAIPKGTAKFPFGAEYSTYGFDSDCQYAHVTWNSAPFLFELTESDI